MTSFSIKGPAKAACASCPYNRSAPSGIWVVDHYTKLLEYDRPFAAQPPSAFMCHKQDGRLCAGWLGCHGVESLLGIRFLMVKRLMSPDDYKALWDWKHDPRVPLFASGAEAAAHGLKDIESPGDEARRKMDQLMAKPAPIQPRRYKA